MSDGGSGRGGHRLLDGPDRGWPRVPCRGRCRSGRQGDSSRRQAGVAGIWAEGVSVYAVHVSGCWVADTGEGSGGQRHRLSGQAGVGLRVFRSCPQLGLRRRGEALAPVHAGYIRAATHLSINVPDRPMLACSRLANYYVFADTALAASDLRRFARDMTGTDRITVNCLTGF